MVALSRKTGETAWQATNEQASYSSPIVADVAGRSQAIFVTRLQCLALDPPTGKVLWQFPFGARGPTVNAATPLLLGDLLFVSASYGVGAHCARLTGEGPVEVWSNNETLSSQYTTGVVVEGKLYGIDGRADTGGARLRCVDPATGRTAVLSNGDLAFAYRHSRLQQEPLGVLSARFQLQPGQDPDTVSARTSSNLHSRTSTQPYQLPSCGSVFRNPEPQKAGRLIEGLGLKGHRIGGAEVSTLHANFIVNTGAARADDMAALIAHIQERVDEAHGIRLHPEVMRLGRFGTGS